MTFTVGTLTRCPGQSHWSVTITFQGGQTVTLLTSPEEMQFDPQANLGVTRDMILARLRSASREAGAVTFAQAQAAVNGKTFQL